MKLCETNIDAINVIEDKAGKKKWDQASRDLGQDMPVGMICTCDRRKSRLLTLIFSSGPSSSFCGSG